MLIQALCSISYPLVKSNWCYSPETPNLGQIRRFLALCDLETWRMTLLNNRAPLLSNIKLYVSFHHHMWIQTAVTVRKRLSWVATSVTLTFDLDLLHGRYPGARFTNDFLPAIQIRWKFRLAVILLLAIRSQQIFAHATTAQLSCHVQNFVAITVLELRWEWNEISIEFELRWKNR